eukprot:MONOS_9202.1-p1 / transcript=MONOS_9202.1 / gene=MONOS_9202 / organism=Monocercomonoides_exilis_PA203 / gene_product=unspecified product / transcript_product=unspecified product / location=Mono_scaffold00371:23221-23876(-) / protein_length=182 / sequence_SO=supercontig / SO=protein_coding / is_pseudo=false
MVNNNLLSDADCPKFTTEEIEEADTILQNAKTQKRVITKEEISDSKDEIASSETDSDLSSMHFKKGMSIENEKMESSERIMKFNEENKSENQNSRSEEEKEKKDIEGDEEIEDQTTLVENKKGKEDVTNSIQNSCSSFHQRGTFISPTEEEEIPLYYIVIKYIIVIFLLLTSILFFYRAFE